MPGVDMEPSPSNRMSVARASVAPASFSGKERASKIWMSADADTNAASSGNHEEKLAIVKCTTRFATVMCVIIAVAKVAAYLATKKDVVRTSALDSLGDLVANCMTLYTGYRMAKIDTKGYPVGQKTFQHIGCLVFSSFMFAVMFGNTLGQFESIIESEDDVGYAALSRFFYTTPTIPEFKAWNQEVDYRDGGYVWEDVLEGGNGYSKRLDAMDALTPLFDPNPLVKFYKSRNNSQDKEEGQRLEDERVNATKGYLVKETSAYEDPVTKREGLMLQWIFLGCCATYKLCLWLYCILYAIPNSGSQVLVALATDKRNDFICTYSAIVATILAYVYEDAVGAIISEEKVDPLVAMIMGFFIMYSWSQLVIEHATILSLESAEKEFLNEVTGEIRKTIGGTCCGVMDDDVKVYVSSEKCTAEIELVVKDKDIPFKEVDKVLKRVSYTINSKEEIDKCIVTTVIAPPPKDPY